MKGAYKGCQQQHEVQITQEHDVQINQSLMKYDMYLFLK